MFKRWKKYIWILIVIQILILGLLTLFCMLKQRKYIDTKFADWSAELIEYNDNAWYIDENVTNGSPVDMIYSPYIKLAKGSYIVDITYDASDDNNCYMDNINNNLYLKADGITLDAFSKNKTFRIETTRDIDKFKIRIQYNGIGYLAVSNVSICESKVCDIRRIACLFFCFILLDLFLYFYNNLKRHRTEIIFLLLTLMFASLPEMIDQFYYGHDLNFHLLRIEGIAQELTLGHFPAKLHSLPLDGYGYPVSVYYGDIFLYIPALLRIIGFSVVKAYKIYILVINAATVVLCYICFKKIFHDRLLAMIGTSVYVLAPYRLIDIYERAAVGEYTALMAYPLMALALYRIYTSDSCEDRKEYQKSALLLSLSMTILISSHILSMEMTVWFLFLICIVLIKKTCRKNTLKIYGLAVFETLLLNAYFLVPLIDYYLNEHVKIMDLIQKQTTRIQLFGAYIGQYFSFFGKTRGTASASIYSRFQLTPGIILMASFIIAVCLLLSGKKRKKWIFHTFFAFLSLFMASNLFPWDYLSNRFNLFYTLSQVQFPWRYIGIALIFLSLLLCEILNDMKKKEKDGYKKLLFFIFGVNIFMACYVTSDLLNSVGLSTSPGIAGLCSAYDTAAIDTKNIGTGEYLRTGTKIARFNHEIYYENTKNVNLLLHKGSTMVLHCESENMPAYIEVPFLHYKGYHVRDDSGNEYAISDGRNNVIGFTLPAHFTGNITIRFEEPLLWRAAEIISLTFALILIFSFRKKYHHFKDPHG